LWLLPGSLLCLVNGIINYTEVSPTSGHDGSAVPELGLAQSVILQVNQVPKVQRHLGYEGSPF
jgi:hypothetical protein